MADYGYQSMKQVDTVELRRASTQQFRRSSTQQFSRSSTSQFRETVEQGMTMQRASINRQVSTPDSKSSLTYSRLPNDEPVSEAATTIVAEQSKVDAVHQAIPASEKIIEALEGCCDSYSHAIDPHTSRFLPFWDLLIVTTIIIQCFILPYQVGFCLEQRTKLFESHLCQRTWPRLLDTIYAANIILNFVTSVPHPVHKRWVRTPSEIVILYLHGNFLRDVMTVLPYHEMAEFCIGKLGPKFRAISLLKLIGLVRVSTFKCLILRYEALFDIPFTWLKLVKLFIQLCMAVHWMACGWGFVLLFRYYLGMNLNEDDGTTWVSVLREAKPALFGNSMTETPMELYTASLYWSTMTITSIGYGDITATNSVEAWSASLAMGVCGLIWAYIIGSICAIASAFDDDTREHEVTMENVNRMIRMIDLPRPVAVKLREYFMCLKSLRHREQQALLVRLMSPALQTSVLKALEDSYLHRMWFLHGTQSHGYLLTIFEAFVFVMYPTQETIQLHGSMVVLLNGLVLRNARILPPGSLWGIEEILLENPRLHTMYTAISLAYCDMQHMTKHTFQELTWRYPKERKRIRKLAIKLAICRAMSRKTVKPSWTNDVEEEEGVVEEIPTEEPFYIQEMRSRLETVESKLDKVLNILQPSGGSSFSNLMSNTKSMATSAKNLVGSGGKALSSAPLKIPALTKQMSNVQSRDNSRESQPVSEDAVDPEEPAVDPSQQ